MFSRSALMQAKHSMEKTAQSLHGWQPSTRISAFYCRVILSKRTRHIYEKAETDAALAYAAEQAQSLTIISRFLRGIWYSPPGAGSSH